MAVDPRFHTTQNLRRWDYGPRPATLQQVANAGYITGANISGMTAGEIGIAGSATSITGSIPASTFVARAGDTMTGPATVGGAIKASLEVAAAKLPGSLIN